MDPTELVRAAGEFSRNTDLVAWFARVLLVGLIAEVFVEFIFREDKSWAEIVVNVLCAVVVAVGVWGETHFGEKAAEAAATLKKEADSQIAQANGRASQADERASKANEKAEREALKRVEIQKRLLLLAERGVAHRLWTDSKANSERLAGLGQEMDKQVGITLLIQPVPDFRVRLFAENFAETIRGHGWEARLVDESRTGISPFTIAPGPTLFVRDGEKDSESAVAGPPWQGERDPGRRAALLLAEGLGLLAGQKFPVIGSPPARAGLEANTVLLTVGLDEPSIMELQRLNEELADAEHPAE